MRKWKDLGEKLQTMIVLFGLLVFSLACGVTESVAVYTAAILTVGACGNED